MPRNPIPRTTAAFAALMLMLCVGAAWSVVALLTRTDAAWMSLPAALIAVLGTGWQSSGAPLLHAVAAAGLTTLATVYGLYLHAATLVALRLGLEFRETLLALGPQMASTIIGDRLSTAEWLLIGACIAIAAIAAAWRRFSSAGERSPDT